jgi:hypothetical protein
MNIILNAESLLETRSTTVLGTPGNDTTRNLVVNVIFTTKRGTLAALKTAGELAFDLGARINLVAPKAVPWALSLTRLPVAARWIEQHLFNLVCEGGRGFSDISIYVLLCRNKRQALMKALRPKSLVVSGGKMTWWPSEVARTAKMLERAGHRVIFAVER